MAGKSKPHDAQGIHVGVYLERTGGVWLSARAAEQGEHSKRKPWPELEFLDYGRFIWRSEHSSEGVTPDIGRLVQHLKSLGRVASIGVSSPGHFLSLDPNEEGYGQLHKIKAVFPFQGINLNREFKKAFSDEKSAFIRFLTDGSAVAIGEAMARGIGPSQVLVALLVTDGIGAGMVSGRTVFPSALHPEIGMLHVRRSPGDPLKIGGREPHFSDSLSALASNEAMAARYCREYKLDSVTTEMLSGYTNEMAWQLRGYYLAQAVLGCTTLLAPHQIVIAADLKPDNLLDKTLSSFRRILKGRTESGNHVFEYKELEDVDKFLTKATEFTPFESNPKGGVFDKLRHTFRAVRPSIALTGAAGMCLHAAWEKQQAG